MQEFFLDMIPPRTTAQMKKGRCVQGRVMFYDPPNLKKAKAELVNALLPFKPKEPAEGALFLQCQWIFPVSAGHKSGDWKLTRPDTDNLQKNLKDCMTQVGFWYDDAQVCSELVTKKWGKIPGIAIRIEELNNERQ